MRCRAEARPHTRSQAATWTQNVHRGEITKWLQRDAVFGVKRLRVTRAGNADRSSTEAVWSVNVRHYPVFEPITTCAGAGVVATK